MHDRCLIAVGECERQSDDDEGRKWTHPGERTEEQKALVLIKASQGAGDTSREVRERR